MSINIRRSLTDIAGEAYIEAVCKSSAALGLGTYAELRKMLLEQDAMNKDKSYMNVYPHWYGRYLSLCRNDDALLFWREAAIEERKGKKWLQNRFNALQKENAALAKEHDLLKAGRDGADGATRNRGDAGAKGLCARIARRFARMFSPGKEPKARAS